MDGLGMNSFISGLREKRLRAYEASPGDIKEHFGIEQNVLAGGYGYRQVLELVQNGADAILEAYEDGASKDNSPHIEILLSDSCLYAANTGAPFSEEGIEALLSSHSSPKRGNQIGRFGLGFKSLLRLDGKITISSGDKSFELDPDRCRAKLRDQFGVTDAPGLRLAWEIDEVKAQSLQARFPWATSVVCAEITSGDFLLHLDHEINQFPVEFLLFLPTSVSLALQNSSENRRELYRLSEGRELKIHDGQVESRWQVIEKVASISDEEAKNDATHVHSRDEVPLAWAMRIDGKREDAGRFWSFFPTQSLTAIPGILNAPWKLNSDRNAIIPGEWNKALMSEAAKLIADELPQFIKDDDPGSPLDAFPRQLERKDEVASHLVEALWTCLKDRAVIPDATGRLRHAHELWLHPRENKDLAYQWADVACERKRKRFVHPSCLARPRGGRLKALAERLKSQDSTSNSCPNLRNRDPKDWFAGVASSEISQAIQVLQLVEAFKEDCKPSEWKRFCSTLKVIACESGRLQTPDKAVLVPREEQLPQGFDPVAKGLCNDSVNIHPNGATLDHPKGATLCPP